MGALSKYEGQCRKVLCLAAKQRETITYGKLAAALGLKSARQQWGTLLNPLSENETKKTGADLTLIVVYASGPAQGLSRYFSNVRDGSRPRHDIAWTRIIRSMSQNINRSWRRFLISTRM